jgi:hypothetical protein
LFSKATLRNYEPLFSILDSLHQDGEKCYWKEDNEPEGDTSDIEADTGQMGTDVEIVLPMSHNFLTKTAEQVK